MIRLLFIGFLVPTMLLAQEKEPHARGARVGTAEAFTGKTHAVIIGISLYDTIPSLNFAHRDAEAFSRFLHSAYYGGGPVKDTLMINSKAKKLDIIKEIKSLYHRVEEGDRIIIFFAGHGDREVESGGSYLLAYDTFLNNYSATAVSVDWLKRAINTLITDKKVTVWLIADACRSGDFKLAGDFVRGRYRVWESWQAEPGELNLLSCQSKELSYEADKWDNGHGIFSYFLLRGLKGEADSIGNNDTQIRVFELDAYLKLKVPAGASPSIQTPLVNTSDLQTIVATIPPQIVKAQNQSEKETDQQPVSLRRVLNHSRPNSSLRQTPATSPSQSQKNSHKRTPQRNLIPGRLGAKADTIVQNQSLRNEALYFELMTKVQPILLAYLSKGANAASAETYAITSNQVAEAEKLLSPFDLDYIATRALKHFLLGVNFNKTNRVSLAIAQLDSAVALDTLKAFIYYERGTAYLRLGLKDRADQDFKKAMQLSPTWNLLRPEKKATLEDDNEKQLVLSTEWLTNKQTHEPSLDKTKRTIVLVDAMGKDYRNKYYLDSLMLLHHAPLVLVQSIDSVYFFVPNRGCYVQRHFKGSYGEGNADIFALRAKTGGNDSQKGTGGVFARRSTGGSLVNRDTGGDIAERDTKGDASERMAASKNKQRTEGGETTDRDTKGEKTNRATEDANRKRNWSGAFKLRKKGADTDENVYCQKALDQPAFLLSNLPNGVTIEVYDVMGLRKVNGMLVDYY